jgi:hypothetical protein
MNQYDEIEKTLKKYSTDLQGLNTPKATRKPNPNSLSYCMTENPNC